MVQPMRANGAMDSQPATGFSNFQTEIFMKAPGHKIKCMALEESLTKMVQFMSESGV